MSKTWILVADSSRARIFSSESADGGLIELMDLSHNESRLHEQELTSDLPGRTYDSAGQGRHAMGTRVGVKEQEALVFAKEIADQLDKGREAKQFNHLVIAAPPHFLGLLRDKISARVRNLVTHELDRDLVQLTAEQLRAHLPERVHMA